MLAQPISLPLTSYSGNGYEHHWPLASENGRPGAGQRGQLHPAKGDPGSIGLGGRAGESAPESVRVVDEESRLRHRLQALTRALRDPMTFEARMLNIMRSLPSYVQNNWALPCQDVRRYTLHPPTEGRLQSKPECLIK
jgi:hypothetical protein